MSVLSAQTIRQRVNHPIGHVRSLQIDPFSESKQTLGMSYGLSVCGYDIRLGRFPLSNLQESLTLRPGDFILCSSLERVQLPRDLVGVVHDKSTLARRGLALQNTVLEPGWGGYITLELSNHGIQKIGLIRGMPIAQILFHQLDQPTEAPYVGKYQDQPDRPVESIDDLDTN